MATVQLQSKKQRVAYLESENYITRAKVFSRYKADEVLDLAAENSSINRGHMAAAMHAVIQTFTNFLAGGHSVELPEVGTFRFAVNAKMASTKDEAGAKAVYRRKVLFTPSPKVKALLKKVTLSTLGDDTVKPAEPDNGDAPIVPGGDENNG